MYPTSNGCKFIISFLSPFHQAKAYNDSKLTISEPHKPQTQTKMSNYKTP